MFNPSSVPILVKVMVRVFEFFLVFPHHVLHDVSNDEEYYSTTHVRIENRVYVLTCCVLVNYCEGVLVVTYYQTYRIDKHIGSCHCSTIDNDMVKEAQS